MRFTICFAVFSPNSAERALIPPYRFVCWIRIHNMFYLKRKGRAGICVCGGYVLQLVCPRGHCEYNTRVIYWSGFWKSWQHATIHSIPVLHAPHYPSLWGAGASSCRKYNYEMTLEAWKHYNVSLFIQPGCRQYFRWLEVKIQNIHSVPVVRGGKPISPPPRPKQFWWMFR